MIEHLITVLDDIDKRLDMDENAEVPNRIDAKRSALSEYTQAHGPLPVEHWEKVRHHFEEEIKE